MQREKSCYREGNFVFLGEGENWGEGDFFSGHFFLGHCLAREEGGAEGNRTVDYQVKLSRA